MPAPRVEVNVRKTTTDIERLETFRTDSQSLAPVHQYLIAELVMLRLFSIIESAIEDMACKLVAGAPYVNGTHPARLFPVKSVDGARSAMLTYGRTKAKNHLRWTSVADIRESTSNVLQSTDPFITYARIHGNILSEMRKVRNFLAHRSPKARQGYREVVRVVYGANSRVRIEAFLTSRQRGPVAKVDEYLTTAKIIIADLARG